MVVAERQGREKPTKIEQRKVGGPRTRGRTSSRTNSSPSWPNLHKAGPGRWGWGTCKKRSPTSSLLPAGVLLSYLNFNKNAHLLL